MAVYFLMISSCPVPLIVSLPLLSLFLGCARTMQNYSSYNWKCLSLVYVNPFGSASLANRSLSLTLSTPLSS